MMCLTNELDIPISFKHLQRLTRNLGIRFKKPGLSHGKDYGEGKKRVENYKYLAKMPSRMKIF
jgi:hypothetical protein